MWAPIFSAIGAIHPLARILLTGAALFSFIFAIFAWVGDITGLTEALTIRVNQAAAAISVSGIGNYLGQADRIFPWSEVMTMTGILIGLKLAAATLRIIKSWIPTVN